MWKTNIWGWRTTLVVSIKKIKDKERKKSGR